MSLLVVRSAISGEVLTEFDGVEFQRMVGAHGSTVKILKIELKQKGLGCRFQLRLFNDTSEMQDDEMLLPPLDLKLVTMSFCPSSKAENQAFIEACSAEQLEEVEMRLKKLQDPNTTGRAFRTALHQTARQGHLRVVRLLLEATASCNQATVNNGETPLHCAASGGRLDVARLLLEAAASCDQAANNGETPLHCAASGGCFQVMRLLLKARASCDRAMNNGTTPLHWAVRSRRTDVVCLLLEARASCGQAMNNGTTPLHWALRCRINDVVCVLVEARASCDEMRLTHREFYHKTTIAQPLEVGLL